MRKIDMEGKRFTRLLVLSESGRDKWGQVLWNCICDCGKEVITQGINLRKERVKSCGCYSLDMHRDRFKTHGLSNTPTHKYGGVL